MKPFLLITKQLSCLFPLRNEAVSLLEYAFMVPSIAYVVNNFYLFRLAQQMGALSNWMGYYVFVAKR